MARYRLAVVGVIDQDNGNLLILPNRIGWAEYEVWLLAGNTPDPIYVPPVVITPEEQAARDELIAREAIREELRLSAVIQALRNRTPAQVDNWIDTNVTDLASAKTVLKILARVLALLARERIGS